MAQFRTTADILDSALRKAGEVTNGNSPYEADALEYLNVVHFALLSGGTIPVGKDTTIEIDEVWPWSRAKSPIILELQPKHDTGTISLTNGSTAGTFSSAPASSLEGWHIKVDGKGEWFKIVQHTAASASFSLDSFYASDTGTGLNYKAVKLDYDLVPSLITVNDENNKIQFQEVLGTTITATVADGIYTPSDLCTAVDAALDGAGTADYTSSYSAITKKFTIASDRAGGVIFSLVGAGDQSKYSIHKSLGFDDIDTADAASVESVYVLGGISRLIEPFVLHRGTDLDGNIYGIDNEAFQKHYPFHHIMQATPSRFTVIREDEDGSYRVRFNSYPKEETRVIVNFVPIPRDLKDDASSIPIVPRKHLSVLEDAATFRILVDKSDDRAAMYAQLMQGKIEAMVAQNRGSLARTGKNFGQIVSRPDNVGYRRRRRRNLNNFGYE